MIITSFFGPRPKPNGPTHPGLDFAAVLGQAVRAVLPGVVLRSYYSPNLRRVPVFLPEAGPDGLPIQAIKDGKPVFKMENYPWRPGDPKPDGMGFGETVLLLHEDGRLTRYAHFSKRLVRAGERVAQGQILGQAGTSGYSFGVHLHFELRGDGGRSYFDPLPEFAHLNPAVV